MKGGSEARRTLIRDSNKVVFFFSIRRRHTRSDRDWSSDVCSSDLAVILLVVPWIVPQYTAILLTYGLIMAIGALGFNLLLGYTGLLSFGHSAYFGVGAYVVALMVKYLRVGSMELFLLGAIVGSVIVTAVFGFVCVRYTRIFFGILTL